MAYGEHQDYLAACELLSASEIALILGHDAGWTLPRGRGAERRMAEARSLIEGTSMRTPNDIDPPVRTPEQLKARERDRLAAIAAMTGGTVPDLDEVSDQPRPEPDKEKLMATGKPTPMACVETNEVWPSVGALHASLGDTISRSGLDYAIKAGKQIAGKTYKPAASDATPSTSVSSTTTNEAADTASPVETDQPVTERPAAPTGKPVKPAAHALEIDEAEFLKPEAGVVVPRPQQPSSPASGKDVDVSQIEQLAERAEIAADHRGRVRFVFIECDDCSAETVGGVLRELGKLFT